MKTTRRLSVRGRVQGVGYRESMRVAAMRLGCTGWVRNRADGSVEVLVQGSEEAVTALVTWAHRGPPAARVESVDEVDSRAMTDVFERFEVLRSA